MGEKFYYLDHTAEVLENYRKIQENKIFDRILHDERQKKAFLKNESRRVDNLLESTRFDNTSQTKLLPDATANETDELPAQSSTPFLVSDFLAPSQRPSQPKHSHFRQYESNKKELVNLGISRMLADVKENEELQQYIAEKSYETASLGETSADELALRSASDMSDNEIDIYKTDEISAGY